MLKPHEWAKTGFADRRVNVDRRLPSKPHEWAKMGLEDQRILVRILLNRLSLMNGRRRIQQKDEATQELLRNLPSKPHEWANMDLAN